MRQIMNSRSLAALLIPLMLANPLWAQTPQSAASSTPAAPWGDAEWQALLTAKRHTQSTSGYEFKAEFFDDLGQAKAVALTGLGDKYKVRRVDNLVSLTPSLRMALLNLMGEGAVSKPIESADAKGVPYWTVLQLVRKVPTTLTDNLAEFKSDAYKWIGQGVMRHPHKLLADPLERSRAMFWGATTAQAVAALPADANPNVEYGNFETPLTRAMLLKNQDLAKALVARGANVNQCGLWGCPLAMAAAMKPESDAMQWTEWLLSSGVKPDLIDARHIASSVTALTEAAQQGHLQVATRLVAAAAPLDGVPGERLTPVEGAAGFQHRDLLNWLITKGASVLPFKDRSDQPPPLLHGSLYSAAAGTGDASFAAWAEKTMLDAAAQSPRFRFEAFVEQGGKRWPLSDGKALNLKAAPFQLVFVMKPGGSESVTVGASLSKAWQDEVRRGEVRNPLFRPFSAAMLHAVPAPESLALLIGNACAPGEQGDAPCPGVQMVLHKDPTDRRDFHAVRQASHEHVREVRSVVDISNEAEKPAALPLDRLAGKTLYLVLSDALVIGAGLSEQRLIGPRYASLTFGR